MSKSPKLRPCPALGGDISPADCGGQRHSRLACPEHCPHNPFASASYSHALEIEDRLDRKTVQRLEVETHDHESLQWEISHAKRNGVHGIHAFFAWKLFFEHGADQTTFAERWERSGFGELKNDERVLLRGKMRMRIALLEIHRISEAGSVEAVDLLSADPKPMVFLDRNLAGRVARFSTLLAWTFPMPHYWRLSGSATAILDVREFSPPEIVREIVGHLGGPLTEPEIRRWLAEHFAEFDAAQMAVARLRRRQMLEGLDAKFGKAVYELRATFAQCRKRLDALPDVTYDDVSDEEKMEGIVEARAWLDQPPKIKQLTPPGAQVMLGRILLGPSRWRLQAMGGEKLSRLRRQFEDHLGERVRFFSERVDDLGVRMSSGQPDVDASLAPPRLLEDPDRLLMASSRLPALPPGVSAKDAESEWMHAANRAFLDDNIPALSNRTPREAASDPALRPKLIHLMKQRVRSHDERNLKTGRTDDINWMIQELELTEIIFDPPPWRPPPEPDSDDDFSEPSDFDESFDVDPNRPPAPPLPAHPFDLEEAIERLQVGMDLLKSPAAAEEELSASGATVLEDAYGLTVDLLTEKELGFAVPFFFQAWFALVPPGCRAPEIDLDDLEMEFESNLRALQSSAEAETPEKMESFFLTGPQPGLTTALLGGFLEAAKAAPRKLRPGAEAQSVILVLLKTIVDTLDAALR